MTNVPDQWLLKFPSNDAGESEGLGNAAIETFRDRPYASVARECGQNSKDSGSATPVKLSFDALEVDKNSIPSIASMQQAISGCLNTAEAKKDEKEFEFFKQASAALSGKSLHVLRIADSNTKGLVGPCVEGRPFHSLLKGEGVSVKENSDSGGSFGIGKNAVFAVSDLQTVFYSTAFRDDDGVVQFLAQGKTKLVSHTDVAGNPVRSTGYWGNPKGFLPIADKASVPQWMVREEIGTSVFAMGFREVPNWEHLIAYSVLQNFFPAIHRGEMEFSVNSNKIKIDRLNLESLIASQKVTEAAMEDGHLDDLQLSQSFLECLTSSETIEEVLEIEDLGKVSVKILIREKLPKRVAILRNGMLITTDLRNFGEGFQKFPGCKDFTAVVEPVDHDGRKLFKQLENPRHDELSAGRIADPARAKKATKALKLLGKSVRDRIRKLASMSQEEAVDLSELGKYFAGGPGAKKTPDPKAEEDLSSVIVYQPKNKPKSSAVPKKPKGEKGDQTTAVGTDAGESSTSSGGTGEGTGGGGQNSNNSSGGNAGSKGEGTKGGDNAESGDNTKGKAGLKAGESVELYDVRTLIPTTGANYRKLLFTPSKTGKIEISIAASGLANAAPLVVQGTENGSVQKGIVILEAVENVRATITIQLSQPYEGPVEVEAIGAKP